MKIYLLRHGETDWSRDGRLQGRTDIPMNEKGFDQVNAAGEFLYHTDEIFKTIISSPLIRARKSAEIVADKIGYKKEDIVIEQDFIERSFGLGEGLTPDERCKRFPDGIYPDIETVEELCKRAGIAITKCVKKYYGSIILIVAHGAVLKAVLTSATKGKYPYNERSTALGTGEICLLEYEGGVFNVVYARKNPAEEI